jgi:Rrf2 family iron-sulfur cluster assembly transcriptional regulator
MRFELTKRADYAVRSTLALARAPAGERRSVRYLANEQNIPVRFLPQVMRDLVAAGIVEGTVGRSGGYRLARPASAISLLEVVEAIEGDGRRRDCVLRNAPCGLTGTCDVHAVFEAAQADVLRRLQETSISAAIGNRSRAVDRRDRPRGTKVSSLRLAGPTVG